MQASVNAGYSLLLFLLYLFWIYLSIPFHYFFQILNNKETIKYWSYRFSVYMLFPSRSDRTAFPAFRLAGTSKIL